MQLAHRDAEELPDPHQLAALDLDGELVEIAQDGGIEELESHLRVSSLGFESGNAGRFSE